MNDNYKKVVNLQAREEEQKAKIKPVAKRKPTKKIPKKSRVEEIDHVYADHESEKKTDFNKIERPVVKEKGPFIYKQLSFFLLFLVFAILFYFLFFSGLIKKDDTETVIVEEGAWYAVQLTDKETYYGYIENTTTDPIVIENVYYNYNQVVGQEEDSDKSSSIRLVKRGKEAHGPDGTMRIVRSQVLFMEPLRDDSKILRAILEYEK